MATSLSQQLAQVQSYNAAQLGNSKSASKAQAASYLFPPQVASSQDLHTLQSLGANGWEELLQLDNTFTKWNQATSSGDLLFSESSRSLDRLMKGKYENEEIDRAIIDFLQLVGGNLLDRSTGKCIEWLVRRFRVHEYNVESVLSAFMPYHETQEFARILQLVDLRDKPHFEFLLPLQKRAVPLPSSVLIATFCGPPSTTASLSTLRWVIGLLSPKSTPRFRRANFALQTFWFSSILKFCVRLQGLGGEGSRMGVVKGSRRSGLREDSDQQYLSILLPATVDAATTTQLGMDCQIGGCLALSSITTCFKLSVAAKRSVIASLVETKMDTDNTRKAFLTCLACLCMNDGSEGDLFDVEEAGLLFTGTSSRKLASKTSISEAISTLGNIYDTSAFVSHLSIALCSQVKGGQAEERVFAVKMLEQFLMDSIVTPDAIAEKIVRKLFLVLPSNDGSQVQECLRMLAIFRQRRPNVMDAAVSNVTNFKDKIQLEAVWKVMKSIMAIQAGSTSSSANQSLGDVDVSLWMSINDAASSSRVMALQSMFASIKEETLSPKDRFVRETLLTRLSDDSEEVISAIYHNEDILLQSLGIEEVVQACTLALSSTSRGVQDASQKLVSLHLSFLLRRILPAKDCTESVSWQIFKEIFWPRMLFTKRNRITTKIVWDLLEESVKNSSYRSVALSKRVNSILEEAKGIFESEEWSEINIHLAKGLAKDISGEPDEAFFTSDVEFLIEQSQDVTSGNQQGGLLATLTLYLLLPLLEKERFIFTASRITDFLKGRVSSWTISAELPAMRQTSCSKELIDGVYSKPTSSKTPIRAHAHLLNQLASHVSASDNNAIVFNKHARDICALVYNIAVQSSFSCPSISSQIFTALFSKLGDSSLTFLASTWTTHQNSAEVRLASLRHALAFFAAFAVKDSKVRYVDFQTIVPSLLVALKDSEAIIRLEALECFLSIQTITKCIEDRKKEEFRVELYGYDTIYGKPASEHLKYLDTADVLRLTTTLLSVRDSFEHDAVYVNTWLSSHLGAQKGEGKRDVAYKKRILEVLFSHVLCWPNYEGKLSLLDALEGLQDESRLSFALPLIREIVQGNKSIQSLDSDQYNSYVKLLVASFDRCAREALEADDHGCWTLFVQALETGEAMVQKHFAICLQQTLFGFLSELKQREVFARLADLIANSASRLPQELRSSLRSLEVDPTIVVPILYDLRNVITTQALKTSQTKRAKCNTSTVLDESAWTKALAVSVEILESLLSRKQRPTSEFLAELFEDLRLGIELLLSHQTGGEYLMQVSMSNLSVCVQFLSSSEKPALAAELVSSLRVDTIVNVIKTPCNPQTFQQALLLLSTLGSIAPEVVLHNAMPIFTFVGSTMLQRDDDYSFVVIQKTLQSILPPVIKDLSFKAKGKTGVSLLQDMRSLLCVFTDAAKHVPRHRRVSFFDTLIDVMGDDCLGPICMLLTDRYAYKISKQVDVTEIKSTIQLPLILFTRREDRPKQQWKALNEIWEEINRNWSHRSKDSLELQEHVFLDCVGGLAMEHEGRRVDPIRRIIALTKFIHLAIIDNLDALEEHSSRIEEEEKNHDDTEEDVVLMWKFIEYALYMARVEKTSVATAARVALEEVMKIVPVNILFKVISKLLNSATFADNQNGLHLCAKSVSNMSDKERQKASTCLPQVVASCFSYLQEKEELAQSTLETLQAIAEDCLPSEHSALSTGVPILIKLVQHSDPRQEQALDLLNILSKQLGSRMIPQLSNLINASCTLLSSNGTASNIKASVLDLLTRLASSIPVFFASHIGSLLNLYIDNPSLQELNQSARLMTSIVRYIAPAQLFSTIISIWEKGDKSKLDLHMISLGLLERTIKSADKKSINLSYKAIFRHLASIFDTRRQKVVSSQQWMLSTTELALVEDKAVSVFLKLVLRLNESTFRPLFLRICDWAMLDLVTEDDNDDKEEETEEEANNREEITARKVVLFKVVNTLLAELGELVTNYYLNVLDGAVETLDAKNKLGSNQEELWKQVLISLEQSARADRGRGSFWNDNRIKIVIPSLVGQVTDPLVKNSALYESLLGDAVAALCQTVPDENCLKLVNNLLLEKTRSNQAKVKVTTIRILVKLWKSKECEDTLLGLVAETVPSIAELLQESEVIVQEELSTFVNAVEQVLGEGLEGYLQ